MIHVNFLPSLLFFSLSVSSDHRSRLSSLFNLNVLLDMSVNDRPAPLTLAHLYVRPVNIFLVGH